MLSFLAPETLLNDCLLDGEAYAIKTTRRYSRSASVS